MPFYGPSSSLPFCLLLFSLFFFFIQLVGIVWRWSPSLSLPTLFNRNSIKGVVHGSCNAGVVHGYSVGCILLDLQSIN